MARAPWRCPARGASGARLLHAPPADVLRGEARADGGREAVSRALVHVVAVALAAAMPRPRHVAQAERRVGRRVKHEPPAPPATASCTRGTLNEPAALCAATYDSTAWHVCSDTDVVLHPGFPLMLGLQAAACGATPMQPSMIWRSPRHTRRALARGAAAAGPARAWGRPGRARGAPAALRRDGEVGVHEREEVVDLDVLAVQLPCSRVRVG